MPEGTKQNEEISKQGKLTWRDSTVEKMTIQEVISQQTENVKWREASDKILKPLRTQVASGVCWTARNSATVYNSLNELKAITRRIIKSMSVTLISIFKSEYYN